VESLAATAGQTMLLAGGAVIVVALAAVVPSALRAQRKAVALRRTLRASRYELASAVEMIALQRAETDALLAPWRRIWRWVRHPLVVATLQWCLRRRRARRRRRP
jgi:hypothetical protein